MKLFLVGLTGAGKSTLGRQLAARLDIPYIDLDEYIIGKEGKSISEIFLHYGETYFRQVEHEALLEIIKGNKQFLLSTGGGAPCFHDNMDFMNASGLTIYLKVPIDTLSHRLYQGATTQRPMFAGKTWSQVHQTLEELLVKRKGFYEESKLVVEGSNINIAQILQALEQVD